MKHILALGFLAATAAALATGGSITANGGVSNEKEGVATFWASIQEDKLAAGRFIFASEGTHNDYPDVVFKSVSIDMYMAKGNTVMIHGRGLLYHMIPVNYMATFVDGGRTMQDEISLHAWNSRNFSHIVHFDSRLTDGNIVVRPGK